MVSASVTEGTSGVIDVMCGLNMKPCVNSHCADTDGQYNGICCELSIMSNARDKICLCFAGYKGDLCHEHNDGDISDALATIKELSTSSAINVTVFGVFLGVMALTLSAIVLFVVIRMSRKKKVIVMEEAGEPCSPRGVNDPADKTENVFVVKRGNSVMRYSSYASSCCHQPSVYRQSSQLPLSPTPSGSQCISPQVHTKHGGAQATPLQPHAEEDEVDDRVSKPEPAMTSSVTASAARVDPVLKNSNEYIVAIDETAG